MTRRGVVEQPLLSNGSSTAKQEHYGFLFVVGSSKKVAGWKCQEPTRKFSNLYAYTSQHSCWYLPSDAMNLYILCIARKNHFLYPDSWMLKQREGRSAAFLAFHVTWGTHPRGIVAFSLIWLNTQLVLEHRHSWFLNSFIHLLNVFVSVCVWDGFVR